MKLDKAALPGHAHPQDTETQPLQVQAEALEEETVQLDLVPEDELDVVVRRQPGRQACANIKESRAQALKELPDGFCVCEAGGSKAKRLHRLGVLLDGARCGLLCVLVQRTTHGSGTRVRGSVQALQRSLVHASAARQWLRHGSVHGH